MAEQLFFDWPTRVALDPGDFFVSTANVVAFGQISAPDTWPLGKMALIGPKGSGKSHLARVFQHQTGAVILPAAKITPEFVPPSGHLVIEDMETLPASAEEAVFHAHNHLASSDGRLLLTSAIPPARWPIALPDLASRMQATLVANITDPDDRLLAAVIMKQFQDRQIAPAPGLPAYLAARIERSFAAAAEIVAALDAAALAQRRDVNEALARGLLDKA
jgi:chromosomal replication initiation ATPase DnaA